MQIEIKNLSYYYSDKNFVFDNFSLSFNSGSILGLMGMSGSGKSTFLKLISKILKTNKGEMINLPQKIHYVFQDSTLIPWLSLYDNLLFCSHRKDEIDLALKDFGLISFKDYYPSQLSGGMAQKVNLIRAYLSNPELILLDEPFSHLDQVQRDELLNLTLDLWKMKKPTIIFVSHNIDEVLYLSQSISFLSKPNCGACSLITNPLFAISKSSMGSDADYLSTYKEIYSTLKENKNP